MSKRPDVGGPSRVDNFAGTRNSDCDLHGVKLEGPQNTRHDEIMLWGKNAGYDRRDPRLTEQRISPR